MNRTRNLILLAGIIMAMSVNASAYPMFLEAYKTDKFTNPKNKDVVCNFCHMSPSGGDDRNPFGQAFERGGEVFTPMLRAQYPDRFSYPTTKVDEGLTIHFSDPENKVVIIETAGKKVAIDASKQTVDGKAATAAVVAAVTPTPAEQVAPSRPSPAANLTTPAASAVPVDPLAREGAFFGSNVVDLPNGKPLRKGEVDFLIGHRFPYATFQSNSASDFFGFDSGAIVTFGFNFGVTDRVSVGIARSNYFRTIQLSSAFQVARQGGETPLTLQLRASIEGRNNFHNHGYPFWVGYAPSLQVVATRTFKDRVTLEAVPTFAFNTRDENSFQTLFGATHDNTTALGLAAGIRILKTVSLVGEAVPRWGFRGEATDRPTASFGIQKATFRHTFSLIFSDARSMTVNRYAQGTGGANAGARDAFGIGFNIYRRIH
jgi:hypothetical protein